MPAAAGRLLNRAKEQGSYDQVVVRNVLVEFNKRLEFLEKESQRIIPLLTDTRRRRITKAVVSFRVEGRIQRAEEDINKYQQNLTLWIVGSGCTTGGSLRSRCLSGISSSTAKFCDSW